MWATCYDVYKHPEKGLAVCPRGFSIWAYLFPTLWSFASSLWVLGAVMAILSIAAGVFEQIYQAGMLLPGWAVVVIALFFPTRIYMGFKGGYWKARRLERRGYQFCGEVAAFTSSRALWKARKGDFKTSEWSGWAWVSDLTRPFSRLFAVAGLTWKAAFRFRLFWVLAVLLLGSVIGLPFLIQDDGTARGFIQIMLTYTLSVITALLGFSTIWLACGTLARDIEDCSMQMVAVKPIARWQIWLGKFLGITLLNAVLLGASGFCVYCLLHSRTAEMEALASQARQAGNTNLADYIESQLSILRNEIFVARAALKEPIPDFESAVNGALQQVIRERNLPPEQQEETRRLLREEFRGREQVVPPNHLRRWTIDLGLQRHLLRDRPLFMRVKFHVAVTNQSGSYLGLWTVGPPDGTRALSLPQSLAADTFHEIQIRPNLFDDSGKLTIDFENRNPTALIFPLEDGLEVLYEEGGFGLNFARGFAVILCWLALLAALGLAAASLLSFPVAAFCSICLLLVGLFSGTLSSVVSEGTVTGLDHETGAGGGSFIDVVLVPLFKIILSIVKLVKDASPIDALSTGRSITWGQLGAAFGRIVLLLGGLLALVGITCFTRRELAASQTQS